jgi:hypothetical protein
MNMGLAKSRKPYPRSVLVVEDLRGELELEGRQYKKVYKVSTISGIQQHLIKHWRNYFTKKPCLHGWSYTPSAARASNEDLSVLVIDVEDYEKRTGLRCIETSLSQENPNELLDSVSGLQGSLLGQLDKVNQATEEKIKALAQGVATSLSRSRRRQGAVETEVKALAQTVATQAQMIEKLLQEVEALKLAKTVKPKAQKSQHEQLDLF